MIDLLELRPDELRPLRRVEYEHLIEDGYFDEDERIELLVGLLVAKEPPSPYHSDLITRVSHALMRQLDRRAQVRVQMPFAASDDSEPEPDIAIVPYADYRRAHPSEALLLVEVAVSSSKRDRTLKAAIYAQGNVQEYWVVDVGERATFVFRGAIRIAAARSRARSERKPKASGTLPPVEKKPPAVWTSTTRVPWTEALSPLAFPDVLLGIADFS